MSQTHRMALHRRAWQRVVALAQHDIGSGRLAVAVGVGVLIGCSPFFGLHLLIGVVVARVFRLNQLAVLLGEQISIPPFAPLIAFGSVQAGHLALTGGWADVSQAELTLEAARRFAACWLVGSALVGCALGLSGAGVTYVVVRLARRRAARDDTGQGWTGRSRGTHMGYAVFILVMRAFGRRGAYFLLWMVVPYYVAFARTARRACREFHQRVFGRRSWWRCQCDIWRHLHAFGRSMIDGSLIYAGRSQDLPCRRQGFEHIRQAALAGKGAVLLSAHVGSRVVAGQRLSDLPVSVVMYQSEADRLRRYLARHGAGQQPRIIVTNDGPAAVVAIRQALQRGELVAMLADRVRGAATIQLPFLGCPALFPRGPFALAAACGAPVIVTFGRRDSSGVHHFYALPPLQGGRVPRAERERHVQQLARAFVAELERFVRAHPFQWFNFYDFWRTAPPSRSDRSER